MPSTPSPQLLPVIDRAAAVNTTSAAVGTSFINVNTRDLRKDTNKTAHPTPPAKRTIAIDVKHIKCLLEVCDLLFAESVLRHGGGGRMRVWW